ncbi:MAG: rhomboid family intramembrane serine protease [Planctomycetes bacterium]|jgi:GlpG protein|nr:rhomboid family intramembrane serine protease [Planctomycetota bacterium]
MRSIGHLPDEDLARRFGDFLYTQGIENQVDPGSPGTWEIWVLDDVNVEPARQALGLFVQQPEDPRFVEPARAAARQRFEDQQAQVGKRTRTIDARTIFYAPPVPLGILSLVLIGITVAVAVLTGLGEKDQYVQPLSITQYQVRGQTIYGERGLPEIRHGQIWRLFTPMFLHFGFLHIFFNMLWLRDLGSMIEARKSSRLLLALVLVIAGISNLAQYVVEGPTFGGMSGVVYGLLGYMWMQGKFDPASRLSLEPQTVTFMIAWFFLCLFGVIGNIANTAHGAGLGVGVAWGYLAARWAVARRQG